MNFKKLLLSKCEKQFYKKLKLEQQDRRSRRASMEEALLQQQVDDLEQEFNRPMLLVFDNDDLKKQQRNQMHGNMQLIVELFKLDLV